MQEPDVTAARFRKQSYLVMQAPLARRHWSCHRTTFNRLAVHLDLSLQILHDTQAIHYEVYSKPGNDVCF